MLGTLRARGAAAAIELTLHAVVAVVSAAAARALWDQAPAASRLATVAILAVAIRSVQSLYWSVLPSNVVPGSAPLIAAITLVVAGLALAVLLRPSRDLG